VEDYVLSSFTDICWGIEIRKIECGNQETRFYMGG